VSEKQ